MRRAPVTLAVVAVLAVIVHPSWAQEPATDSALRRAEELLAEAPDHAGVMLRAARALAAAGAKQRAVEMIGRAVSAGADVDPDDGAFATVADVPSFAALAARAREERRGSTEAEVAYRLNEADLVPEGIAWDPVSRTLFVGSIARHKVVAVGEDGQVRDLTRPDAGLRRVLGLAVDAPRRLLWAATYSGSDRAGGHPVSTLVAVSLPDGGVVRRIDMEETDPHLFNDVAPTKDGTVYVTDTAAGTVYRLRPGSAELEPLLPPGTLRWANGLALDEKGNRLYVADFSHGVAVVDLSTGDAVSLGRAAGVTVCGIDGLYRLGGDLVAVQNECGMPRVVRFRLDETGTRATSQTVLLRQGGRLQLPTTAVVAGGNLLLVADSLVDLQQEDGSLADDPRVVPPSVLRVPLGK